jgi:hypothetical protein
MGIDMKAEAPGHNDVSWLFRNRHGRLGISTRLGEEAQLEKHNTYLHPSNVL